MNELIPILLGAGKLGLQITLIIVGMVTVFEVLRYFPVFRRAGRAFDPVMSGIGLSATSIIPLFTGIFLGISYGAGIILRVTQERKLPARELFLLGLFLSACHGVIEDTLIFVVIGGNGWVLIGVRLCLAVTLTVLLARIWKHRDVDRLQGEPVLSSEASD